MTTATAPSRSQLDLDIVTLHRFFEAWAAGDVSRLDMLVDEDVVVAPLLGLLYEREAYRGRSGVAAAFRETASRWHSFELKVEHLDAAGDRLVADVLMVAGRHGMSSELPVKFVCELRDGLIASLADDEI